MRSRKARAACVLGVLGLAASHTLAQDAPPSAPGDPPAVDAAPQRVEVNSGRLSDAEQRRLSTAAKIIVGREEIERLGDSTLGEVLKRLPGVMLQGAPGRGGAIRMRGLGQGYTQILLDGQRVPAGFSIDSLVPEQIERIEILRAPTAETGARAIAGTINIVTREGFNKRLNDVHVGVASESGHAQGAASWTRNESVGPFVYNLSLSAFRRDRDSESVTTTTQQDVTTGATVLDQREHALRRDQGGGVHLNARLEWRPAEGETLMLTPMLVRSQGHGHREAQLEQSLPAGTAPYARAVTDSDSRFTLARMSAMWRRRLVDGTRLEWNGAASTSRYQSNNERNEYDALGARLRNVADASSSRDRSLTLNVKASKLLEGDHNLVTGAEFDSARRAEAGEGTDDTGGDLRATSTRTALYGQDEWQIDPHWAAHAGLRWEGIATRGQSIGEAMQTNRSAVWTPLLHALWKPDPKGLDQVRMSLTRSYRSPTLSSLIGRPLVTLRHPPPEDNTPTTPDRAGNPNLRPELATGVDVAVERYLSAGGILSANLFHRRIKNLMRSVPTLETVPWSATPRWVARPQNIGDATTQGIELEAKFRLSDAWPAAPAIDVRSNASFFRSRVAAVPGPDNRLDQQADATANLGADYRLPGTPLTLGGNVNWTPGYVTRESDVQVATTGRKRVFDAYALWVVNPATQLRLTATNLAPLDYGTGDSVVFDNAPPATPARVRETAVTTARSYVNWQLRLELKL